MMESAVYSQIEAAVEQLKAPDRAYLTAMAEAVTQDNNDFAAPAPVSPTQKRKRGAPSTSSAEPRRTKRNAPAAAMSSHHDINSADYVESAVEAAQAAAEAAAAANVGASANMSAADFAALQQATADHHHESADPANAPSTAAAALNSMYPTIHVPQTTEETFAAQASHESEQQSFGPSDMMSADGLPSDSSIPGTNQAPQNGVRPTQPPFSGHAPKAAVGSEEWHKQRKDSHKEGTY
jgi:hypothetical protein